MAAVLPTVGRRADGFAVTEYIWKGSGADNALSTAANWAGGAAPPASGLTTTLLAFGASTTASIYVDQPYATAWFNFSTGATAYTVTGGPLTLGSSGVAQSTATPQLFNCPVALGVDSYWSLYGPGTMTFAGGVDTAGHRLSVSGTGGSLAGPITGSGSVYVNCPVTLTGTNTYTGGTNIGSGALTLGSAGCIPTAGPITLGSSGTLRYTPANTTDYSARFSSAYVGGTIDTGGQSVTFATGLTPSSPNSKLTKAGAGTLTLSAASKLDLVTVTAGTLAVTAAGSVTTATAFVVDGPVDAAATLAGTAAGAGGLMASAQVTVGQSGRGTLTQAGGTVNVQQLTVGAQAGAAGVYNLHGGVLNQTQGVTTIGGRNGSSGIINQTGGTFTAAQIAFGDPYDNAATTTGAYNLSGGVLVVASVVRPHAASAVMNFDGGTLRATAATNTYLSALTASNVIGGGLTLDTAGYRLGITRPLTHDGPAAVDGGVTKTGAGTLVLYGANTYSGRTLVTAGTLEVASGGRVNGPLTATDGGRLEFDVAYTAGPPVVRSVGAITVTGTGSAVVVDPVANNAARSLLVAPALTTNDGGTFDLGNNDLRLTAATVADVTALARAGFNAGRWSLNGGLASQTAAADAAHLSAVGVIPNTVGGTVALYPVFDAAPADASDVLARYTYYGDANLDGRIDAADYTRLDAGLLARSTGWFDGDFNYDGTVDASDYTLADNAFNHQAIGRIAAPAAAVARASAVPEPTTAGSCVVVVAAFLGRRRCVRRVRRGMHTGSCER